MDRKFGVSAPILGRERARSPSHTKSPGPRPISIASDILIHAAIWAQHIWAENWGAPTPFGGRGAGSPSNTMWPGPRTTCMPSFILIRPTVWPQYTIVTDRQDRTDRQPSQHRANRFTNGCPKIAEAEPGRSSFLCSQTIGIVLLFTIAIQHVEHSGTYSLYLGYFLRRT